MVGMASVAEGRKLGLWTETFGEECGRPLCHEKLNLFHASHWISEPATAATAGCGFSSYVALLGFRLQWCSVELPFFLGVLVETSRCCSKMMHF
jgi:hypothetical protein